jgi:hypothetical protein
MKPPKSERIEDALMMGMLNLFLMEKVACLPETVFCCTSSPGDAVWDVRFPNHSQETASGAVQMSCVVISTLWYVGNKHGNLEIFLFPNDSRTLTQTLFSESKLVRGAT